MDSLSTRIPTVIATFVSDTISRGFCQVKNYPIASAFPYWLVDLLLVHDDERTRRCSYQKKKSYSERNSAVFISSVLNALDGRPDEGAEIREDGKALCAGQICGNCGDSRPLCFWIMPPDGSFTRNFVDTIYFFLLLFRPLRERARVWKLLRNPFGQ
jgi:hypothetical protein